MAKKTDKRTKEYKQWKAKQDLGVEKAHKAVKEATLKISVGLGDTVEKVLESPIIKPITEAVKKAIWKDGKDCGCDKRRTALNKKYRYKHVQCMFEEEHIWFTAFLKRYDNIKPQKTDIYRIAKMFGRLFKQRAKICGSCGPKRLLKEFNWHIDHINKVYETYESK